LQGPLQLSPSSGKQRDHPPEGDRGIRPVLQTLRPSALRPGLPGIRPVAAIRGWNHHPAAGPLRVMRILRLRLPVRRHPDGSADRARIGLRSVQRPARAGVRSASAGAAAGPFPSCPAKTRPESNVARGPAFSSRSAGPGKDARWRRNEPARPRLDPIPGRHFRACRRAHRGLDRTESARPHGIPAGPAAASNPVRLDQTRGQAARGSSFLRGQPSHARRISRPGWCPRLLHSGLAGPVFSVQRFHR
jgi:hypothetical protein